LVDIERADPTRKRRWAIILVVATIVVACLTGAAGYWDTAIHAWLLSRLRSDPAAVFYRLRIAVAILGILICVPTAVYCIHLWRYGSSVEKAQRFPPPGLPVIRDTIVVHGQAAVIRGRMFKVWAVILTACAGAFALSLWRFIMAFFDRAT
jgi:hypothetical protein